MSKNKYIESPERMWELFKEYKTHVKANPRFKTVFVGKDGDRQNEDLERPLTYEGFCNYLADKDVISTPEHYFMNYQGRYDDYVVVCTRIKRCIREDQIEGGMVGQYNASITQRLNGLTDKVATENVHRVEKLTVEVVGNDTAPPLAGSESEIDKS